MQSAEFEQQFYVASDGLKLSAYSAGTPNAPEILFLHGYAQASLCWSGQFNDPDLAQGFHLSAVDLRGHGASDKPDDPQCYQSDQQFADDLARAMDVLGLGRPVIVAWSYAGRILCDYINSYGTGRIAGINFVSARVNNDPGYDGPVLTGLDGMFSRDLGANITATRDFVRGCFDKAPSRGVADALLACAMVVPPEVRAAHMSRPAVDNDVLDGMQVPVLVSHGEKDRVVLPMQANEIASRVANARLSLYPDAGHAPFVEDTARFNAELAAFVQQCQAGPAD